MELDKIKELISDVNNLVSKDISDLKKKTQLDLDDSTKLVRYGSYINSIYKTKQKDKDEDLDLTDEETKQVIIESFKKLELTAKEKQELIKFLKAKNE